MDDKSRSLRFTLEEIERLLAMANRVGVPVEPWVEEVAAELRSHRASAVEDGAEVAGRMRSDPGRSRYAHAQLDPAAMRALKT